MSLDIRKALHGQTILVTGFTGFMGKVLVEKLLRTCSPERIFVLVRHKKGKTPMERVEAVLEDPLFALLEKSDPDYRNKLTPIEGDCGLNGLGLDPSSWSLLTSSLTLIFHGAATVRFDEPLRVAHGINVVGTREVVKLAKETKGLKGLVHVSTAYAYSSRQDIEEKLYERPMGEKALQDTVDTLSDELLAEVLPKILGAWPNTYCFTKAMAESVVSDSGRGIPRAIYRPAVVVGTSKEPLVGWTDNIYGPTGIVVGAGMGVLKSLYANLDVDANLVPVDYAVSCLIAVGAELIQNPPTNDEVKVYNYVSCSQNRLNWREFKRLIELHGDAVPPAQALWCYSLTCHKIYLFHRIFVLFLHYLPALLMDAVSAVIRSKNPRLIPICRKIDKFGDVLKFFSTRNWKFTDDNVVALSAKLVSSDDPDFNFDIKTLNWDEFFYNYIRGLRKFILKESEDSIPEAMVRWQRFKIAHKCIKIILLAIFLRFIWSLIKLFY